MSFIRGPESNFIGTITFSNIISCFLVLQIGKNLYQWHGSTHRLMTLAWLRQLALKLSLLERYNEAKQHCEDAENYGFLSPCSTNNSPAGSRGLLSPFSPTYSSTGTSPASSTGGPSPSPIERKTSLGVACQKFLMLFLIAPEVIYTPWSKYL